MNNREIAENLKNVAKLYADAIWNYDRALDKIEDDDIRQELIEMKSEHTDHFMNLSQYIRQLGDRPPQMGYTGEIAQGLTVVTDEMNTEEIMKTLRSNEKIISEKVQELADEVQIPEIAHDLEEDIEDDRIHIDTLKDFLQ